MIRREVLVLEKKAALKKLLRARNVIAVHDLGCVVKLESVTV